DGAADLHAQDLAALVSQLSDGPAHTVAHSAGAHASLFFAANHPDKVRTLSINEPPASGVLADAPGGPEIVQAFTATLSPARAAFRAGDIEGGLRLFNEAVSGPGDYEQRPEAQKQMMRDNAAAHVADAIASRPRPVFTSDMARALSVRALITNGA